ncbi:surface protein pspA precursor [Streptococcus pneumoniae]|nr:surface protein pspA precursor [Streptococcus pneumoniae]
MNKKKMILTSLASVAILGAGFVASQPTFVRAEEAPQVVEKSSLEKKYEEAKAKADTAKKDYETAKKKAEDAQKKYDEGQKKTEEKARKAEEA